MYFKASLDIFSRITTTIVAILFLVLLSLQVVGLEQINYKALAFSGSLYLILFLVLYGFHTTGYTITATELIIHHPFQNKRFNINEITRYERLDRATLRKSIRSFGVGGVLGYWGKFAHLKYGGMTWYATKKDQGLMIVFNDRRKILVTPDDLLSMIEKLDSKEEIREN